MLLLSKNNYSQFFLNGHLYKTGISLGLTPGVGPMGLISHPCKNISSLIK